MLLKETHWQFIEIINLDEQYKKWYRELIHNMDVKKEDLISKFGSVTFDDLHQGFVRLFKLIENQEVGGGIVRARKMDRDQETLEILA